MRDKRRIRNWRKNLENTYLMQLAIVHSASFIFRVYEWAIVCIALLHCSRLTEA
jgi:hypothetical protein